MERLEWFLFNLLAVGPFAIQRLPLAEYGRAWPGAAIVLVHADHEFDVRRYWLEHDELPARTVVGGRRRIWTGLLRWVRAHVLGIADGCLGYEVITRWEPS